MVINDTSANAVACCDESGNAACNGADEQLSDPASQSSNHGSCHVRSSPAQSLVKSQGPGKRPCPRDDCDEVNQDTNKRGKILDGDDGAEGDDNDPHIGRLSKEAEVFALQAIHTSLLQKMSEVGRVLAGVMKENRAYKSMLYEHLGQNEEDFKRVLEIQVARTLESQTTQKIGDADATLIAAAALGKNLNSPADAMEDILKLYRYAPSPQPKQPQAVAAPPLPTYTLVPSRSDSASEGTRA